MHDGQRRVLFGTRFEEWLNPQAAATVLRFGRLILGEQTERFEAEFVAAVGVRHAVAVSSGTVALESVHRATGATGRVVLVPANTNYATAAAQHAGAWVQLSTPASTPPPTPCRTR